MEGGVNLYRISTVLMYRPPDLRVLEIEVVLSPCKLSS